MFGLPGYGYASLIPHQAGGYDQKWCPVRCVSPADLDDESGQVAPEDMWIARLVGYLLVNNLIRQSWGMPV